jgi:thymidylate synthase (FAD)
MKIVKAGYKIIDPEHEIGFIYAAKHIERMGRIAYKSEDKITEDSWREFVPMIVKRGHESVLEHASMAVVFIFDRGITHEQVRHRLCSFTQESTRYCNYSKNKFGNSISVVQPGDLPTKAIDIWLKAVEYAEKSYFEMLEAGCTPQQARSVLPTCTKSEIGVTANFREWRHIFRLRAISRAAHPQMREVMVPLYEHCKEMLPEVFDMGEIE